jgi:peptidyl-tRNA hydrolase
MVLYDSINTPHNLGTVDAEHLLDPAPVDGEGKVAPDVFASSSTSILFSKEFFNSIESADQVILIFTLNTTGNEVVKIYSDYRIKFNASLILRSDINVNLK